MRRSKPERRQGWRSHPNSLVRWRNQAGAIGQKQRSPPLRHGWSSRFVITPERA
jgi:hypothetical protein